MKLTIINQGYWDKYIKYSVILYETAEHIILTVDEKTGDFVTQQISELNNGIRIYHFN